MRIGFFDVALKEFDRYDTEQSEALARCPKCDCCGEEIQDEYLFDIGGELYCKECLVDQFRRSTDSYIED